MKLFILISTWLLGDEVMINNNYILELSNISKSFSGVKVLNDVNLKIKKGEVHALLGENGAGKSTLMKILMGLYRFDKGSIVFKGKKVHIDSPSNAHNLGITMIHQELTQIPQMTIAENIFLGREYTYKSLPFLKRKEIYNETRLLLDKFGIHFSPNTKMSQLSVAQMQMIEIIKAISYNSSIIIMDEPTSALSEEEANRLFKTIKELKRKGVSIIYISHRLEEIFELADRVTVLRDGNYIGTENIENIDKEKLISMMVGRELTNMFPKEEAEIKDTILQIKNFTKNGVFNDININVRKGEILGIYGLVGAGRSEVMRAVFGIDKYDSGEIFIDGKKIEIKSPKDAIKNGLALVPEDRKDLGLILCRSIKENVSLSSIKSFVSYGLLNIKKEKVQCKEMVVKLSVKMNTLDQNVQFLSGGNQQKVVLAKWLLTNPKVLILDEPTRGIDVGAKAEIHYMMSQLAKRGIAIIMISSELPEILGVSDRIVVMSHGKNRGEFVRGNVTQESILRCALGR